MSFASQFVRWPKKFNLCQKVPLSSPVFSLGCASATNSSSGEKDALFGLDTQITKT
jgi:hypothetical protein